MSNVVSIFKNKKVSKTPLKVNHLNHDTDSSDFNDRTKRIRESLNKINSLMLDLKKMADKTESLNKRRKEDG